MISVGILGGSGYVGAELLRICASHPEFNVVYATGDSQAGTLASSLYPSLTGAYPNLIFDEYSLEATLKCDVVFLALPHEASLEIVPNLLNKVRLVVDCSAAFRLKDASLYPQWYGFDHTQASGVSGAGRAAKNSNLFCTVDEDFTAYGLLDHRHTPEIEQVTGAQVLFTPHLAPMNRGILATCYARPVDAKTTSTASLLAALSRAYAKEPFVVVRPAPPSTKATLGSNSAHLSARYDERTGYVMVLCAIDNLTKGAAGGAVQAANVALGLDESFGLSKVGMFP